MKFKRVFVTLGACIAAAGILAACGDGGGNKEKDPGETQLSEEAGKTGEDELKPADAATVTAETETTESGEAVSDVYGDGVDPVTAKSSENGLGFLREQLAGTTGRLCGFAYLGTLKEGVSLQDMIKGSDTARNFKFIADMDANKIISDGGDDVFVFVPTDADAHVQVNTFAESDNGKVLYSSDKGTPVLIRTKDELNDSMEIVITDSAGNVGHFTPDITTGSIADVVYKDVTGYNFTTDTVVSSDVNRKYMLDTVIAREPDITDLIADGTGVGRDSYKRIYIDDLEFYTLDFGREEGGRYVTERLYAVSKDGTLVYRYNPDIKDWADLEAFNFNSEQYR